MAGNLQEAATRMMFVLLTDITKWVTETYVKSQNDTIIISK